MKKIILIVGGIILIALLGRLGWAFWQVQKDAEKVAKIANAPVVATTTVPIPANTSGASSKIVLSAIDIKAKEDLKKTISGLTESIKLKCTAAGSKDTQCETAKKVVDALTIKCIPLANEKEISDCIFSYGAGAVFSSSGIVNTSTKASTTIMEASSVKASTPSGSLTTITLKTNGSDNITVKAGDSVNSVWSSKNADTVSKDLVLSGCSDSKVNTTLSMHNMSEVNDSSSFPVAPELAGCTMKITITANNKTTGAQASASNTITIK